MSESFLHKAHTAIHISNIDEHFLCASSRNRVGQSRITSAQSRQSAKAGGLDCEVALPSAVMIYALAPLVQRVPPVKQE